MDNFKIKSLSYAHENQKKLFDQVDISIPKYSIVRLFGENGSGKTTLLRIIANVINDKNLTYELDFYGEKLSFSDIRKRRVFVPDSPTFYEELTMDQNIKFYNLLFKYGEAFSKNVYHLCKEFNVYKYLDQPVKNLSLGTRQKLFLSINLSIDADLVLLDEPFNSLDNESRNTLASIINKSSDRTFIIVSHEDSETSLFTHELNSRDWKCKTLVTI
jgi:ABC-2 type transport system ATP-binding protein